MERGKLLVAVLAMALIVASIAIVLSTSESNADGDVEYTPLPEAVDGVITINTGGSYQLTEDITADIVVSGDVTATIDLAGYKITNNSGHTITVSSGASLTIEDSSDGKTGTVDNVTHAKAALYNNGGTVTINGGTFLRSAEKGTFEPYSGNGNSYYTIYNLNGTMTINYAVVENNGQYSSCVCNGQSSSAGATLTINGGEFTGGVMTIKNDEHGTLTITGGDFTCSSPGQGVVNNWNVATISGGTFTSVNGPAVVNGTWNNTGAGQLTVTGGIFYANADYCDIYIHSQSNNGIGTISISDSVVGLDSYRAGYSSDSYAANKLDGSIAFGDNKITLTGISLSSGEYIILERGSVVISGNMTADETNAKITGAGDVVLKDLTVTGTEAVSLSGTISIEGKVNIENATVEDGTTITVAEDAIVNLPADVLAEMTYKDGATIIINDLEYTVYNKVLSTNLGKNVSFAVGVAISNPEYDGDEITLRDLSPQVILISVTGNEVTGTDTSSARFDASLTEIVNGPAVNVGTYNVVVAVELNYNGAAGNVSNYFYPTASFSIVSPEPDVTLEMDGWNVNIGYDPSNDAPTFEYVLNGVTYTNETENPFTVTYTLVDSDGTEYAQDQWGSIDTAGTYTLNAVFSSWNDGNYKSVTETTTVELTDGTVGSEMVFSETDLSEVYGVYVDRLQTEITVGVEGTTVTVSGTVYYLASFPGFWGEADDKPGYYVVFDAVAKNLSSQSIVTVTGSGEAKTLIGTEYDGYWVLYLGDISETTPALTQQFTITYDADGEAPLYTETTYTIDLSGIISNATYPLKVILSDERNATEKIDVTYLIDQEGYLQLPNAAGDAGWLTETNVFYAAGSMVKIEDSLDVNGDGMIVFTAQYGSTPIEPGETDPATEVFVSMYYDGDKLVITVSAVEGYIPAGELTITGSYVSEVIDVPGFGLVPVVSQIPETVVTVEMSQSVIILTPEDYGFIGSITALDVTYSADDGSLTADSNHMTFEYTVDSVTA